MQMEDLLRDRLPHAPQMGLFVVPDLPADRVQNALSAFARDVTREEVLALYDATLSGTGRDGAVFTADRFVFQNLALQAPQVIRYSDLVNVEEESRWFGLGGKTVALTVNRGRATFELNIDFSGVPKAAGYVADFLDAAMVADITFSPEADPETTDRDAVREALDRLRSERKLTSDDYERLLAVLDE